MARRLVSALTAFVLLSLPMMNSRLGQVLPSPLAATVAKAAHTQDLGCTSVPNQNVTDYSVIIACWTKVVRPAQDTGATTVHLGVHFPLQFPGIAAVTAPGLACNQDVINGHGRMNCIGQVALGGMVSVDWQFHVVGRCGEAHTINATVANVYGVNSPFIYHTIQLPPCPSQLAQAPAPAAVAQTQQQTQQQVNQQVINQINNNTVSTTINGNDNRVNVDTDQRNRARQKNDQRQRQEQRQKQTVMQKTDSRHDEYVQRELENIKSLPTTGFSDLFAPLEDTGRFVTAKGSDAATPMVVLLSLLSMAGAVGIKIGRRFFL